MTVLYAILSLITTAWAIIGIPVGIIFLILMIVSKDPKQKKLFRNLMIIGFAGLGSVLVLGILFFIVRVVSQLMGGA